MLRDVADLFADVVQFEDLLPTFAEEDRLRASADLVGGVREGAIDLAIPTMFAATFYDVLKNRDAFVAADMPVFAVGFVVSFISALLVIRALMRFITNHDFTVFAWYRIIFGTLILLTWYFNIIPWSA